MKRMLTLFGLWLIIPTSTLLAADAETSASAGSAAGRAGTAAATARYDGDVGFARTDSRSGRVSVSRGVAVGVDKDGLAISVSGAVADDRGRAVATNLNISIERDGDVSVSGGTGASRGSRQSEATAGGSAGSQRPATSYASGKTDPAGRVVVRTSAEDFRRHESRRCWQKPVIRRGW